MNMFGGRGVFPNANPEFDSAISDQAEKLKTDPIDAREALSTMQGIRKSALAIALALVSDIDSGDLDDGELPSDRLDALMSGALDEDDLDEADPALVSVLGDNIADAMSSLGVDDSTIADIFSDDTDVSDSAIEAASEMALENLPDDGEALDEWSKQFIYGFDTSDMGASDSEDDTEEYDAMHKAKKLSVGKTTAKKFATGKNKGRTIRYKAVKVVRHGKVVVRNKRISGNLIMSAKQKSSLRKARVKSHSAKAVHSMMRSFHVGVRSAYKGNAKKVMGNIVGAGGKHVDKHAIKAYGAGAK
jgi:hypothetical protein